ncbi:MAG: hypothetical protein JRJ85_17940 [Deltaproteobacteria bacterium]|nr:hypothetical protein [Deltaproteobacteria bacterium]
MPTSVRLDQETEDLLIKTAQTLRTTKTEILKASIRSYCEKTLQENRRRPYDLIVDLVDTEHSGKGNLAIDGEEILRKAFRKNK